MIRAATLADLPQIIDLGEEFLAYSPHAWMGLDKEAFAASVTNIINGAGAIFLSDDGFIGGLIVPCYFNPQVLQAVELFWFARSEGPELLERFETWARDGGASVINCSGLVDEHERAIRRVFARRGYVASELAFSKRF